MAEVLRRRCSIALKSSCGFDVFGVGVKVGADSGTPAATGAGAIAGAAFPLARLVADGFAAAVAGNGLLTGTAGLGCAGATRCDSGGAVSSTGGSFAAVVGGTVSGAGAGGSVTTAGGAEGGGTEGTETCSDRWTPWCAQAVKPMINIVVRQPHLHIRTVYALGQLR